MKVIWLVSNYPNAFNPISGNFYQRMAEALVRQEIDVTVFAFTPYSNKIISRLSKKHSLFEKYPRTELVNGVKIIRPRYLNLPKLQKIGLSHFSMYLSLNDRKEFETCDVVDAHFVYPFGMLARLIQKRYNLPYTISFIGDDVNIDPFINAKSRKRFIKSVQNSNARISVSSELSETVKKLCNLDSKVINHGLNINHIKNIKVNPFVKEDDTTYLLYVGEVTKAKGIHLIIELLMNEEWARKNDIQWIIIGEGNLVNLLRDFKNVQLKGLLNNDEVISYMKQTDYFVFPSLHEGMPNVLKEAGVCNLPIISSDAGGISSLLNDGERGALFKRGKYDSFKDTLVNTINQPALAKSKSVLLYNYIDAHYNADQNANDLIEVYESAIKNFNLKKIS